MKHLKLFEQFEDEEEPWWDKESEFDKIETKLKIVRSKADSTYFYVIENPTSDDIIFFKNRPATRKSSHYDFNFVIKDLHRIYIYDEDKEFMKYDGSERSMGWTYFYYKDLPKEIKDRLV